ncbi:MAG: YfiR family protein [Planctomycetes bacterium]|nr:YfiR family protein [Planctomycetota bacterium]
MKTKKRKNLDDTKLWLSLPRNSWLICLTVLVAVCSVSFTAYAEHAKEHGGSPKEYQVKAAFLYNFIKFVDWPNERTANTDESITINVIGKDPFGVAFKSIEGKLIKGRSVVVKRFGTFKELKKAGVGSKGFKQAIEDIRKSQLLFICSSEKKDLKEILETLKGSSVLTVGGMDNFLENGGIINFLIRDRKVCFEVNTVAAKDARLKIRSKLLRLAKRVIGENGTGMKGTKTVR